MIGVTVDVGDGTCIAVKGQGRGQGQGRGHGRGRGRGRGPCNEQQYVDGTRFDEGELGIAVRWLSRLQEDAEQRTFELNDDADGSNQFIVNSTELRFTDIELLDVAAAGPAPVRRSKRAATQAAAQYDGKLKAKKYELPVETEQIILKACW